MCSIISGYLLHSGELSCANIQEYVNLALKMFCFCFVLFCGVLFCGVFILCFLFVCFVLFCFVLFCSFFVISKNFIFSIKMTGENGAIEYQRTVPVSVTLVTPLFLFCC